jgi:hypothetical protein
MSGRDVIHQHLAELIEKLPVRLFQFMPAKVRNLEQQRQQLPAFREHVINQFCRAAATFVACCCIHFSTPVSPIIQLTTKNSST